MAIACLAASPAAAQHEHQAADPPPQGWGWSGDAAVFVTGNFQVREFTDFYQLESQNWFMGVGARRVGGGTLELDGMLSLEPFTMRDIGSSQVFQTGETFENAPLIDYQHPHDLAMRLAASYSRPAGRARLFASAAIVGDPALGPTPFMHRASAAPNPTVPLGHHQLDSTHVTPGVITAGIESRGWRWEASAFHGTEPDEDRLDIDLGAPDSWATRVAWAGRGARVQASVANVHHPDAIEPGDVVKVTASVEYEGAVGARPLALTLAWGLNDEQFANEGAWLAEASVGLGKRGTAYGRGEIVDKHILEAGGVHPPGFEHPHILSTVGALTLGYLHDVARGRGGRWSAGGDASVYYTPDNLWESYGHPLSMHVFMRWSPR